MIDTIDEFFSQEDLQKCIDYAKSTTGNRIVKIPEFADKESTNISNRKVKFSQKINFIYTRKKHYMKFLKTFENYEPSQDESQIDQDSPELKGKNTVTEFDLGEDELPEDYIEGDDEMPEGIEPLGESRAERMMGKRRPEKRSREEIMKMIRQKAGAARRRQLLASKPQD